MSSGDFNERRGMTIRFAVGRVLMQRPKFLFNDNSRPRSCQNILIVQEETNFRLKSLK